MNIEKSAAAFGRQYSVLAPYYEKLNSEADYDKYADFIEREIKLYGKENTEIVLELACGTGAITRRLSERGFDMIGIDISENMLSEAYRLEHVFNSETGYKAEQRRHKSSKILYLCQDMCCFELYGTVSAAVCCLDSLNYLTNHGDLEKCFRTLHNYLEPNGVFIFDVNTVYKHRVILADNAFCYDLDGLFCAWQNELNDDDSVSIYLDFFEEQEDGSYCRFSEDFTERIYTDEFLSELVKSNDFELIGKYDGFEDSPVNDKTQRVLYVCRRINRG